MTSTGEFVVGITDDLRSDAHHWFGEVPRLEQGPPQLRVDYLADTAYPSSAEVCDSIIVNGSAVGPATLGREPRVRHIARFGAGFDNVDLLACTDRGVIVTNTPAAVAEPVASAVLCLLLALAHRLPERDRMVRCGEWSRRIDIVGRSLRDSTVGLIGFGSIAREVVRLLSATGARIVVHHPRRTAEELRAAGVEAVTLDELLSTSDFVVPLVPATTETHHLIGARELARMRSDAFLLNVSRGAIVDEEALTRALRAGALAGAGLDVLEREPPDATADLLAMEQVILAPHSLAWSDRMLSDIATEAFTAVRVVAAGGVPASIVNPDALQHPRWADGLRNARVA